MLKPPWDSGWMGVRVCAPVGYLVPLAGWLKLLGVPFPFDLFALVSRKIKRRYAYTLHWYSLPVPLVLLVSLALAFLATGNRCCWSAGVVQVCSGSGVIPKALWQELLVQSCRRVVGAGGLEVTVAGRRGTPARPLAEQTSTPGNA